jgi:hypothetical protein
MLWGYIGNRYLADFVPFLVIGSAVGFADLWRRLQRRSVRGQPIGSALIAAGCVFSVWANVGIAITPNEEWTTTQVLHYVQTQKLLSDYTGHPLQAHLERGNVLPPWAPADQLFVVGNCDGFYTSTGEDYSTVPLQQYQRPTWKVIERGARFEHHLTLTFGPSSRLEVTPLFTIGESTLSVTTRPAERGRVWVRFVLQDRRYGGHGLQALVDPGSTHDAIVITDTATHLVQVSLDGVVSFSRPLTGDNPIELSPQPPPTSPHPVSLVRTSQPQPTPTICQDLLRGR